MGSNIGWDNVVASIGDEGSSDALNKLSVLGANNDGAAARAELRLATPEADSVAKTPGGLFLAYGIGTGWFKQVADAVRDRDTARVRYGIRFVVTFRAIEAFCRVELGAPEGLTPEWCAFQTDDVLEVAADLASRARREGEPPAINDIAAYKKACLAMGTFMAVTYGKIVSDRWTEYVKEVALLGSTFKWTAGLPEISHQCGPHRLLRRCAGVDRRSESSQRSCQRPRRGRQRSQRPFGDRLGGDVWPGRSRRSPDLYKPEAAAFSTDHDHKTAPLASALRKLRSIMAKEAQKGLMNWSSERGIGSSEWRRIRQRDSVTASPTRKGGETSGVRRSQQGPPHPWKGAAGAGRRRRRFKCRQHSSRHPRVGRSGPGAQPSHGNQPPTGTAAVRPALRHCRTSAWHWRRRTSLSSERAASRRA